MQRWRLRLFLAALALACVAGLWPAVHGQRERDDAWQAARSIDASKSAQHASVALADRSADAHVRGSVEVVTPGAAAAGASIRVKESGRKHDASSGCLHGGADGLWLVDDPQAPEDVHTRVGAMSVHG